MKSGNRKECSICWSLEGSPRDATRVWAGQVQLSIRSDSQFPILPRRREGGRWKCYTASSTGALPAGHIPTILPLPMNAGASVS